MSDTTSPPVNKKLKKPKASGAGSSSSTPDTARVKRPLRLG